MVKSETELEEKGLVEPHKAKRTQTGKGKFWFLIGRHIFNDTGDTVREDDA